MIYIDIIISALHVNKILPKKGEKTVSDDRYFAREYIHHNAEVVFRITLLNIGMNFETFEKYSDDYSLAEKFLLNVPALVAVARFVEPTLKERVLNTAKLMWQLKGSSPASITVGEAIKEDIIKVIEDLIQQHVFNLRRFFQDDLINIKTRQFDVEAILDLVDLVIENFPIGCIFCCDGAEKAVFCAADIRAQLHWGMVNDFDTFITDIAALRVFLSQIIESLN